MIQVRTQDVLAPQFVTLLIDALQRFQIELNAGAIVTVDADRAKVRVLPI